MKKDVASYEELAQDHATHWKGVGQIRDARFTVLRQYLTKPWTCPVCQKKNAQGSVCPSCHEARILEVE
jgi:rubrerythrin